MIHATNKRIHEIDMWEFDVELYKAWKLLEKQDYGRAKVKIGALWYKVHTFNLSKQEQELLLDG